jgi:hypothetical protein
MIKTYAVLDDAFTVQMIKDMDIWADDFQPPMEYTTQIHYYELNEGDAIPEVGQVLNCELNIFE